MRARPAAAAAALLVLAGAGAASAAATLPVGTPIVSVGTANGGVQVGTGLPGQPLVGARADSTGICVGFSYQIPFCLPLSMG